MRLIKKKERKLKRSEKVKIRAVYAINRLIPDSTKCFDMISFVEWDARFLPVIIDFSVALQRRLVYFPST